VSWRDDEHLRGALIAPPWALLRQDRGCTGGEPARSPGEPATCLYDLSSDPAQEHNLAQSRPEVVAALRQRWEGFAESQAEGQQLDLDPALVEELRRTGYDFRPLKTPAP
jgi:hypothetical protein